VNPGVLSGGQNVGGAVCQGVTEPRRNGLGPASERAKRARSPVSRTAEGEGFR
jgi:hypothetical protein